MDAFLKNLSEKHAALFPAATAKSQMVKFEEETCEQKQATDYEHRKNELADCLIVCAGLYRFYPNLAERAALGLYYLGDVWNMSVHTLQTAACEKWRINERRQWRWDDTTGTYKHIGTDGHE